MDWPVPLLAHQGRRGGAPRVHGRARAAVRWPALALCAARRQGARGCERAERLRGGPRGRARLLPLPRLAGLPQRLLQGAHLGRSPLRRGGLGAGPARGGPQVTLVAAARQSQQLW